MAANMQVVKQCLLLVTVCSRMVTLNGHPTGEDEEHGRSQIERHSLVRRQTAIFPPRDCADIESNRASTGSGVYTVYLGSEWYPVPLTVYCDMLEGWTVFQRRINGSVDFYRNWNDYERGFGDVRGEFWIGNYYLNQLTSAKRYKLRIDLVDFNGNTRYAEYDNFVVESSNNYTLSSVGSYSGTAGDSLSYHVGQQFTTYDRDNDASSENCAVEFRGAWWYNACLNSNLNGFYYGGQHTSWADGVEWTSWTGYQYSLKVTEMKIKPFAQQ